ncbi:MAG: N-acetyl-gamma-glutamyl-phosphate reductase [Deltaproteobacteria bacterium]|nr:N-acetyl-gamma-glutamyl-phosphate reductase [Deltaproteobacteria bacterium]
MPTLEIKTGILGASGYAGAELLRLLCGHPHFKPLCLVAASQAGARVGDLYPHLAAMAQQRYQHVQESLSELSRCDLVFCALPHGQAMTLLPKLESKVIVDLGGDFRLQDPAAYEQWYGVPHACPELLPTWSYGLPELFREEIITSTRIANPGCYATAAILAAAPLCQNGLIKGSLVINALSGVSGAGRAPKAELHFAHMYEDLRAYKVAKHQHTPEIEMVLERVAGAPVRISFTPYLVPMVRGIHLSCSAELAQDRTEEELLAVYQGFYKDQPFVSVAREQHGTKEVRGANRVFITPALDERTNRVIVTCVLDNLVKGAAGQALQNANLTFGFDEALGLDLSALYP